MVGVAQLVRAAGCGPAGRGFKSRHSPHFFAQILPLRRFVTEVIMISRSKFPAVDRFSI